MGKLLASMEKAVRIIAGEVPPNWVHMASEQAARAAKQREGTGDRF